MATAQKKRTSDWLSQFKTVGCTFSQDIVDGLRAEINELKEANAKLRAERNQLTDENAYLVNEVRKWKEEAGRYAAELQECEKQSLIDQQKPKK